MFPSLKTMELCKNKEIPDYIFSGIEQNGEGKINKIINEKSKKLDTCGSEFSIPSVVSMISISALISVSTSSSPSAFSSFWDDRNL
jgi:hypothetical protein